MKSTREYSILSPVRDVLNPALFDGSKIKPDVRKKILSIANKIQNSFDLKVRYIWIIGSSIGYQYSENSDIDVNISVLKLGNPEKLLELNKLVAKEFNEKFFIQEHPINFKIIQKPFGRMHSDALYNLGADRWVRKPDKLKKEEVDSLVGSCRNDPLLTKLTEEYKKLASYLKQDYRSNGSIDLRDKILQSTEALMSTFKEIKDRRRERFEQKDKEKVWKNKTCENIVYKIAEDYGMSRLYQKLKEIVDV